MSRELGLTKDWHVVIAGLGNLGHALANYGGFTDRGFPVAALVDADPKVVGTEINGITVRHIDELDAIAAEHQIAIGDHRHPGPRRPGGGRPADRRRGVARSSTSPRRS